LSRNYIGNIERGEYSVTVKNVMKISKALGLKPSRILDSL
jgi:transcriptional regulator with XRE-family HTH domain